MSLSLVNGTYNRLRLLQRMVASARTSVGTIPYNFIIVDGGSTDGTLEWARTQRDIHLIEHGELKGAIRAYNDGCEAADTRYVVILNDDIEIVANTLERAYHFMEEHPKVGQGAFGHVYQRRGAVAKSKPQWQQAYGYLYGQCSIIRRCLGQVAGWWGEGYRTYAGDTHLSMRLWELGWSVVRIPGCTIIDYEYEDELRKINNADQRQLHNGRHPDTLLFQSRWQGRLPIPSQWKPAAQDNVLGKAARGTLSTVRFKVTPPGWPERTALIKALGRYGPAYQINQTAYGRMHGVLALQEHGVQWVRRHQPDLVLLQSHTARNAILPETINRMRQACPGVIIVNWNGDCHFPLSDFDIRIAHAVDLQLHISPTLFGEYMKRGVYNIGYWPIGVEPEFFAPQRPKKLKGPEVIFMGALYGLGQFPEAETRKRAVSALLDSDLRVEVYGPGWAGIGHPSKTTWDQFAHNARLYANSRMALSISQARHLWGYTSDRLYNICASGCPALVQSFKGMEEHGFVDGKTCISWDGIPEMLEKARHYLQGKNAKQREAIALAGRELTKARHTWDSRVLALFEMTGGLA